MTNGADRSPASHDDLSIEERNRRADYWEAGADERERLADERDRLADEREMLSDMRDRLADQHDHDIDRRESRRRGRTANDDEGETRDGGDVAAARQEVRRAEAMLRRAEAHLLRANLGQVRAEASAARGIANDERIASVGRAADGADEQAWGVDRRDFVAVDRDESARLRDQVADERDVVASAREALADDREKDVLIRERRIEAHSLAGQAGGASTLATDERLRAQHRADRDRRRSDMAAMRQDAAADRAHASARWGPKAYGPMLLGSFAEVAKQLVGSDSAIDSLPRMLKFVVTAVAGCNSAGITLWRQGRAVDALASDLVAAELDEVQFHSGLGPCPDALNSDSPVYVPQIAAEARWPVFVEAAAELHIVSVLSFGLFTSRLSQWSPLGTLSLYSTSEDAFSVEDEEFVAILAAYAAVCVSVANRRDDIERREAALHRSLSSRDVIGQAKGILMERQRLSAGDAFDVLRRVSQRLNQKLTEVARRLTETGELPEQP
jgi:hypothetical protein